MWIFLNNSSLSIVSHWDLPDHLLVRSRIEGDIEQVFPSAEVEHTPKFDYPYRAVIAREVVAEVMASAIAAIDYGNFKNSVTDRDRHTGYFGIYASYNRMQAATASTWIYDPEPYDPYDFGEDLTHDQPPFDFGDDLTLT